MKLTRTERVDDIPLLLAQMDKMNIAALLDKHFPMHGNWQGLSLGQIVVVWLAYILSSVGYAPRTFWRFNSSVPFENGTQCVPYFSTRSVL